MAPRRLIRRHGHAWTGGGLRPPARFVISWFGGDPPCSAKTSSARIFDLHWDQLQHTVRYRVLQYFHRHGPAGTSRHRCQLANGRPARYVGSPPRSESIPCAKKPLLVGLLAASVLFSACVTEPVVMTITLNTSSIFLHALGATFQLTATLQDQYGEPITDQSVGWSLIGERVATLSATGVVTAVANGMATIQAAAGGVTASTSVAVAQAVESVQVSAGDGQTGEVGAVLPAVIEAQVNDVRSNPIAEVKVAFGVTAGGGSMAEATVATDANGRASTVWTLGTVAGATQTVTVSSAGQTVAFTATAVAAAADSLARVSGNNQSAPASTPLDASLVVRVVDPFGNPVAGQLVDFAIAGGGGSVSANSVISDADGRATTQWTLGAAAGTQTVHVTCDRSHQGLTDYVHRRGPGWGGGGQGRGTARPAWSDSR